MTPSNPQELANEMLASIWGASGFPVDPVIIANSLGIEVIETELKEDISGGLIKEKGKDPIIVISVKDILSRKRFSCAHELGHYVSRSEQYEESYEYIDLRSNLSASGSDSEEVFANQFAACLLMPEAAVRDFYKKTKTSFLLARHFSVSNEAIGHRLKSLTLL